MSNLTEMVNLKTKKFTWGSFIKIHHIANFQIVEYIDTDDVAIISYHLFIDENDTQKGYSSLKEAIVGAIAYEADGPNSQACKFFFKMIKE